MNSKPRTYMGPIVPHTVLVSGTGRYILKRVAPIPWYFRSNQYFYDLT